MKTKTILFGALCSIVTFSMYSCDNDEDGGGKISSSSVGALSSGTDLDKDLPEGYRISSVDDFSYIYDEKGHLIGLCIDDEDEEFFFEKNTYNIKYQDDEESAELIVKLNSKNLVSSITMKNNWEEDDEYGTENTTCSLSYNSNNQLSSISYEGKATYYEDNVKESESFSSKYQLTYSGTRLVRITETWMEQDDHLDKGTCTYTFEYDEDYDNPFFQYTPELVKIVADDDYIYIGQAFAYVGLFGKASSALPTGCNYHDTYYCENENDEDEYEGYWSFGPYVNNQYGALKSADGENYRYTTVGSRAMVNTNMLTNPTMGSIHKMINRHGKKHQHKLHK